MPLLAAQNMTEGERKLAIDVACASGTLDSFHMLYVRAIEDCTVTFFERRASQK